MGSYFQTPDLVASSLTVVSGLSDAALVRFAGLLRHAAEHDHGLYITF
jgi:hypothetical protein